MFKKKFILTLALIIVVLACILSTTAPSNTSMTAEPSYWHVMGEKAHMSFRMKLESTQSFRLDVWLLTGVGAPDRVDVNLSGNENKESLIVLPFEFVSGGPDPFGFEGFDKYTYEAKGRNFIEKGEWSISIAITDKLNQVHSYNKLFIVS